jgi:hypothetical protein
MNNLTAVVLINRDAARVSRSALPDSPVVPEPEPGRARLLVAEALYRLATRLDRGRLLLARA